MVLFQFISSPIDEVRVGAGHNWLAPGWLHADPESTNPSDPSPGSGDQLPIQSGLEDI